MFMQEADYRKTLSRKELEARAFIVPFRVSDFELLQELYRYSDELDRTFDELINCAIKELIRTIKLVKDLRL
jgi:hypothetical protein